MNYKEKSMIQTPHPRKYLNVKSILGYEMNSDVEINTFSKH